MRIEVAEFVRDLARRSPYPVGVAGDLPAAHVRFDSTLLRLVVDNLVRNAYESYREGEDNRPVEVVLARERGRITIAVRDRGRGIPADLADKVFDPFFTDKIHGSGIGLSLARRFVEAARGTLTLAPRAGGGTEARIVLPPGDV
jgi:signal transduction histidine kinase